MQSTMTPAKVEAIAQANAYLTNAGLPSINTLIEQLRTCVVYVEDIAADMERRAASTENGLLTRHAAMSSLEARRTRDLIAAVEDGQRMPENLLDVWARHAAPGMKWIARNSTTGRGLRLHQDRDGLFATPEQAIAAYVAAAPAGEGEKA